MLLKYRLSAGLIAFTVISSISGSHFIATANAQSALTNVGSESSQLPAVSSDPIPEGKVLPKGVARAWILHRQYTSTSGFDDHGNSVNMGFKRNTAVSGFVAEYGITEKLSFRALLPWVYRNDLSLDQNKFQNSDVYKGKYNQFADKLAAELRKKGLCATHEECRQGIDSGELDAPLDSDVTLPTGESMTFVRGKSYKEQINGMILKGATPPLRGPWGLGDMEAGLLYNAIKTDNFLLSTGLGVRAPTGNFDVPEMKRPISGGVYDLGFRLNLDVKPVDGLWLSFQEQLEHALTKATWRRSSMLDNGEFNEATPVDGQNNRQTYEKFGVHHATLLKAAYGFGALHSNLKFLSSHVKYLYQHERAVRLNGEERISGITTAKPASETQNVGGGITLSGLPYRVPVDFEVNYLTPVAGHNTSIASNILETYLRVYARF